MMSNDKKNATMHQQLKESMLKDILSLAIGTRLPSERQLADRFNVCRATVSKVMEELVLEGYLSRKVGSGTFVMPGDKTVRPNVGTKKSRGDIIVSFPDFFSYGIWEMVHYLELAAMRENCNLVSIKTYPESDYSTLLAAARSSDQLLGVVLVLGAPITKSVLRDLDELTVPVIVFGEIEEVGAYHNFYEIADDHFQSGFIKMNTLLEAGHRHIGFVPNEPSSLAGNQVIRGIKQALYRRKLRWGDVVQPESRNRFWQSPMHAGYVQTLEVLKKDPSVTAVIVDTAPGAIGALRALYELKLRCPEDVSVITALGWADIESYTAPKLTLTSVSQPAKIDIAMQIVLDRASVKAKSFLIESVLISRESVKTL